MSPHQYCLSRFRIPLLLSVILMTVHTASCAQQAVSPKKRPEDPATGKSVSSTEVVLASEVQWRHLNPARGDASPAAGTLWGDQTKDGESGFLVRFREGFASPPHIHNITYRGFVIAGELHNDDPNAALMWMPAGSWWIQPAGEVHITAASVDSIGYVEIASGPYLVKPSGEAFDNGERPVNMDATNIVWLDARDTDWIQGTAGTNSDVSPRLTFLWGQPGGTQPVGTMLKLPAGFRGQLDGNGESLRAVVVKGTVHLYADGQEAANPLPAGSYFGSDGPAKHQIRTDGESIVYVRTKGRFQLLSSSAPCPAGER
ncbi:MAG: DUF4437 domain-containing protein [Planctomycetaceae bacterium]|nr:DUF4437 domain-containing protein [Planctomycetaceae bacterium]